MTLYEFTVCLDRCPEEDDLDRLYDAGLDDAMPEINGGRALLHVSRRRENLIEAITSVVDDITQAGFQAVGIESEDLVTLAEIGARTGRSRESVRLLSLGRRGSGGFPAPVVVGKYPMYSWAAVSQWFDDRYGTDGSKRDADTLAAADLLLRARFLSPDASGLVGLVIG